MTGLPKRPRDSALAIALGTLAVNLLAEYGPPWSRRVSRPVASASSTAALAYLAAKGLEAVQSSTLEQRALWVLGGLLTAESEALPPPGGSALGANAIAWLSREILLRQAETLVELGPGASSVLLNRAARRMGSQLRFYGLEHDSRYYDWCRSLFSYHNLPEYRLIHAPYEALAVRQVWRGQWYCSAALEQLPDRIDILVVDGPPNPPGANTRYPAYPQLRGRLRIGSVVLVDDAHRTAERLMIERWMVDGSLVLLYDGGDFVALEVVEQGSYTE